MPRHSDPRSQALTALLGLGSQSARKSYYPELLARLEELEEERNRYKWLFESAVYGIFQADLDRGLLAANSFMASMLGHASPQALIDGLANLGGSLFADGEAESLRVREQLLCAGSLLGYETRLLKADGGVIDVRMNILLRPEAGPLVIEGFVADITERKLAQSRLQQLNDQLERRVQERTRELEMLNDSLRREIVERERMETELRQARDAAQMANLSKDKYLAAASHDLLQPLNAAALLMSTLRERALPASETQLVLRSCKALESAEDLLTDLLDISKLDQSAVRPDVAEYALADILEPLHAEFLGLAESSGLDLRLRVGEQRVRTDFRLLGRILRNLLSNAIRYTASGSVLMACRRRGDSVRIEVWDTGPGIPEDRFQDIFQEFNQLDVVRVGERKGVGLGLAIVDRIAAILGCRVSVRSRLGRGSVFMVSVPLAAGAFTPPVAPRILGEDLALPLQGRRLLVIDNEDSILVSMAGLLGQWGAEAVTALDDDMALEALGGRMPDAILADFHLDFGRTGCEAIARLRDHFGHDIPAVMITADRSASCQQPAQQSDVPVLNKPVKAGKLRAVLAQLLRPGS